MVAEYPMDRSDLLKDSERLDPPVWPPDHPRVCALLEEAEIKECEFLPWGSNYTFLTRLDGGRDGESLAVYKPRKGEKPLWDFPDGTLYRREYAAYLVSEALSWRLVPPTIIREGPHGIGSLQLYILSAPATDYTVWQAERAEGLKRIALFDCLTNNADRKGGHCILARDGRLWGIDHGLTFHYEPKLRTVVWEFRSQPIPEHLLQDLTSFREKLAIQEGPLGQLAELITPREIEALRFRLDGLLEERHYPEPGSRRSVPWPPM